MSGAGNYCRTDSAVPQSAAGAGPRSSTGLGEWRGWGPWGGGGGIPWGGGGDTIGGGGGVVAPDPRAYMCVCVCANACTKGTDSRSTNIIQSFGWHVQAIPVVKGPQAARSSTRKPCEQRSLFLKQKRIRRNHLPRTSSTEGFRFEAEGSAPGFIGCAY